MLVNAAVALALFAGAVSGQTNATSVDPNTVTPGIRASWCNGQENVCKTLCSSAFDANTCNPNDLTYNCTCSSNHSTPDLKDYITSMPYYICEQSFALCIQNHPNDQAAQDNCTVNIRNQCGTLNISDFTAAASTSSASPSASASPTSGSPASGTTPASASAASTSASKSSAARTAMMIGKNYGSSILAVAVVAAFGFLV